MSNLDFEALKGELDRSAQKKSGASDFLKNFVRTPQSNGFVIVRLLPPAPPGMHGREKSPFYVATRTHRLNERSYHCHMELVGKKWVGDCPVCAYCRWLWKESEKFTGELKDAKQNMYRQIKAIERFYFAAIARKQINPDTNQPEENVGPLIFSVGQTVKDKIFTYILGNDTLGKKALGDVTDILKGRDFKLVKVMTQGANGTYPTYNESEFDDPSPLGSPDQVEKWMASIPDLVSLRRLVEADELKRQLKMHLGLIQDEATGFDASEYEPAGGSDEPIEQPSVTKESQPPFDAQPSGNGNDHTEAVAQVQSEVLAQVAEAQGEKAGLTENEFFGKLKKMRSEKA